MDGFKETFLVDELRERINEIEEGKTCLPDMPEWAAKLYCQSCSGGNGYETQLLRRIPL